MKLQSLMIILVLLVTPHLYAEDCVGQCTPEFQIEGIEISSLGNYGTLSDQVELINDTRDIFNKNSPEFMETFGKLTIITKQNTKSHCTANLVMLEPSDEVSWPEENSFITTSEHCLSSDGDIDYARSYITFTKRNGSKYRRNFSFASGNEEADWAILKLDSPISETLIKPLVVGDVHEEIMMRSGDWNVDTTVTAGGYSSDIFKGNNGKNLTYDQQCESKGSYGPNMMKTNCIAYPGASGGALVLTGADLEGYTVNYLVGVNQRLENGNPEKLIVTPSSHIYKALRVEYDAAGLLTN